jgi:ABC-2 type transport system ATP-binding protein
MNAAPASSLALVGRELHKTFRRDRQGIVTALDGVSLAVERGILAALVGPDGAGKTTLMRLAAGLLSADSGEMSVLGLDVATAAQQIQARVGYMPQRFGLYEDLTVRENLDLYADLHGLAPTERSARYAQLMEMTALGLFTERLAGRLSGGMKQKLGLACTLVSSPDLLLLDEPTVGVDPLSRRELWVIIDQLVHERRLTVLVSTAYLDEAEHCGHVVVLHEGKVLAQGPPAKVSGLATGRTLVAAPPTGQTARGLQARLLDDPRVIDAVPEGGRVRIVRAADAQIGAALTGLTTQAQPARFEDGFMILLRRRVAATGARADVFATSPQPVQDGIVVEVQDLVRKFGDFVAVDRVSFRVRRGAIFGLLGPNGAGKTTTFRMLCGLLPATAGTLRVAGMDLRHARASARQRIGYVAQRFSLYAQLTVLENLDFFAKAYGLRGASKRTRIEWALRQFELEPLARVPSGRIPGGFQRRLAMAAALLHEPETLFLDEPTSGADPLARREFWRRITALAEQGVTVIVTTHFMEEAEYCDRVAILDAGRVLAQGTPAEVRRRGRAEPGREPTMEDAFVAIIAEARQRESASRAKGGPSG